MDNTQSMGMSQKGSLVSNKDLNTGVGLIDYFEVTCHDRDGNFKWKETIKNLVTTEGLNYIMETAFRSGSASANWYVGLKNTGAPAAGDTATELPGTTMNWTEYEQYDSATRPALTLDGAFASGTQDNSATPASFTIASPDADVYGVFLVDDDTKGSNVGATVLYGVGDFAAPKVVDADDTLNVTVTLTATSA